MLIFKARMQNIQYITLECTAKQLAASRLRIDDRSLLIRSYFSCGSTLIQNDKFTDLNKKLF